MSEIIIDGGNRLYGKTKVSPAKNSCLPIIAASIAVCGEIVIENAPQITDVEVMAQIIKGLGGDYSFCKDGLRLYTEKIDRFVGKRSSYGKVRASLFTAGALLARFKKAFIPFPGGCKIGERPIDIHIDAFKALGAIAEYGADGVWLDGSKMSSGKVKLRYPSVGATVNAICAALCLNGETVIEGCAKEPEIGDLVKFLNVCGYSVRASGNCVMIVGRSEIASGKYTFTPMLDRIEAGTYALACLACGGSVALEYDCGNNIQAVLGFINDCGARAYFYNGELIVDADKSIKAQCLTADVFPAFPTDLQPQAAAVLCLANGKSVVCDKIFCDRFLYADMLEKFGAKTVGRKCRMEIFGQSGLTAADVSATDLRGGAALCVAALAANGRSKISNAEIICRGYLNICEKINMLGGKALMLNT